MGALRSGKETESKQQRAACTEVALLLMTKLRNTGAPAEVTDKRRRKTTRQARPLFTKALS